MRTVKKTWFIKYLVAVVVSTAIMIILLNYNRVHEYYPDWYLYLLPILGISFVATAPYIRRYVYYSLERINTGSAQHDILFKVILMIVGIILVIPLLTGGVILGIFDIISSYATYKEQVSHKKSTEQNPYVVYPIDVSGSTRISHREGYSEGMPASARAKTPHSSTHEYKK